MIELVKTTGGLIMGKRITAILLIAVTVLVSTACEKGTEEKKEPFGFRQYRTGKENGEVTGERELLLEYENLITESTEKEFYKGEVTAITKKYFDETGSKTLKHVEWIQGEPTVSYEWDMNGRLIRYSEKWEEENPTYGRLYLPSEYHLFPNKGFLDPFRFVVIEIPGKL
jgi:hypothetical protein